MVELTATAGEDSLLYALLDTLKVEASYDLIEKDSDNRLLKKLTYHVEQESDGTVNLIKLEGSELPPLIPLHVIEVVASGGFLTQRMIPSEYSECSCLPT